MKDSLPQKLTLLDCTFRDGGYYTNWIFPEKLVEDYFKAIMEAGVDIVEIGYRANNSDLFKGPFAYCKESFINDLNIPKTLKVAVMVDSKQLLENNNSVDNLFPINAEHSKVDIVRIASNYKDVFQLDKRVEEIKDKGYLVCINLKKSAGLDLNNLNKLIIHVNNLNIEALYLADSTGSMYPDEVKLLFNFLRENLNTNSGFHAHENLELANFNSKIAFKEGATWIDSTISGIGRGPGNAKTEYLLIEFKKEVNSLGIEKLMKLVENYFVEFQNKYNWGSNVYYYLTGKFAIHPSYVQSMLSKNTKCPIELFQLIYFLKSNKIKDFKLDIIDQVKYFYPKIIKGRFNPTEIFENKKVLLLGSGESSKVYKKAIEQFIRNYNPVVVALNLNSSISENLINYRIVCNPIRIMTDNTNYAKVNQPIITPISMLDKDLKYIFQQNYTLDFSFIIEKEKFNIENEIVVIPNPLVLSYSLALLSKGNSQYIYLAGFDGYSNDQEKTNYVDNIFRIYLSSSNHSQIIMLTPSKYHVPSRSIYSFI